MELSILELNTVELLTEHEKEIESMMDGLDIYIKKYVPSQLIDVMFINSESEKSFLEYLIEGYTKDINKKLLFITNEKKDILGFMVLYFDDIGKSIHIETIFIKEAYRGKGILKIIMKDLKDGYKKTIYKNIILNTMTNSPSTKIYKKLGFKTFSESMYLNI